MKNATDRLRWRCRRGLLELDLLLEGFLAHGHAHLTAEEGVAFESLLALPDPLLLRYLLGQDTPEDQGQARVVAHIRHTTPPRR
jgi:antitoxin CptB